MFWLRCGTDQHGIPDTKPPSSAAPICLDWVSGVLPSFVNACGSDTQCENARVK